MGFGCTRVRNGEGVGGGEVRGVVGLELCVRAVACEGPGLRRWDLVGSGLCTAQGSGGAPQEAGPPGLAPAALGRLGGRS